ncbi:MAG: hypothetical protein AAF591_09735 [Verrucomicrobiota bacterium]
MGEGQEAERGQRWRAFWPYGLVMLVGFLAMHGALRAVFYMDDHEIYTGRSGSTGTWWTGWRVIPAFLIEVTKGLAGPSPGVFHGWNLVLHLAVGCSAYRVGWELMNRLSGAERAEWNRFAALLGALVFVSHPLTSEGVHYARCMMIQLVTMFTLVSVWGLVRLAGGVSWGGAALMVLGFVGAMYSKDPGVFQAAGALLIVMVAIILDRSGGMRGLVGWCRGWGRPQVIGAIAGVIVVVVVAAVWAPWLKYMFERRAELVIPHTLTQARIFWEYAARIIWPGGAYGLCVDHYVPWSEGWGDRVAVVSLVGVILVGVFGIWLLVTGRGVGRVCGMLLLLALFPVLLRFGYSVRELMIEYRVYPAMPWVGLLVGIGLAWLWAKKRLTGVVLTVAIVVGGVLGSMQRSRVWASEERLAKDVVARYPLNMRGLTQLQGVAYRAGDYDRVIAFQDEIVAAFEASEAYNRAHAGVRGYDMGRVHENLSNGEQIVVFALEKRDGVEAALAYGEGRLRELVAGYPAVYVNQEAGRLYEGNSLVRALRAVAEKRELGKKQKEAQDETRGRDSSVPTGSGRGD